MKLLICSNHSYKHVGGSERVIQQISETLVDRYKVDCTVMAKTVKSPFIHKKVKYIPCLSNEDWFCQQVKEINPDYTFVYSDCFEHWPTLLSECENLPGKKSIALVGMNTMLKKVGMQKLFQNKLNQIQVVTHSNDYQDYKQCCQLGLEPTVIHNGIDLNEMSCEKGLFREKYGLGDSKILLCVSTFFPGKGQEHLIKICEKIEEEFTLVLVSNDVNFGFSRVLEKHMSDGLIHATFSWKWLRNLPRKEVVSAFVDSDIFVFPSQKEVAPLVILEAMASFTPWVALGVGNIPTLSGGFVVSPLLMDHNGYAGYGKETYQAFADHITNLLKDDNLRQKMAKDGNVLIKSEYNWDKIAEQYYSLFKA